MYNLIYTRFYGVRVAILYVLIITTFLFSSTYDIGDIVSNEDQLIEKNTCYAGNDYDVGESWKLADWNGALNGGNYNVIFIDMAATW